MRRQRERAEEQARDRHLEAIDRRIDEVFAEKWSAETRQAEEHCKGLVPIKLGDALQDEKVYNILGEFQGWAGAPVRPDHLYRRILTMKKIDTIFGKPEIIVQVYRTNIDLCSCDDCERWRERNRFQAGMMPPVDEELAASLA